MKEGIIMIRLVKENVDNITPEYGVLITSDKNPNKAFIANFYEDEESAFNFLSDAEVMGKEVFNIYDPDIMQKNSGYEADSRGRCYYIAYTPDGDEYLQEVRVVNNEPIYIA